MEVKSSSDGLLTNSEVLDLIIESRERRNQYGRKNNNTIELQQREAVEIKTAKYIKNSRIGQLPSTIIGECISTIKKLQFGLTEGEIIQIVNLLPETMVEYYVIIDDCGERLSEDQINIIIEIINDTLSKSSHQK
eukprot:gene15233-20525_t